ncbi:putative RNA-directed DNA polymerase [Tanacetum coccineum]
MHARTLWNKLEQLYARKTGNNKFLIKQMMRLKYTDGSHVTDHLNVFQGIINQLRTSLSNSAPDGVITMELAKGSILNEEMRRKSQGSSSHSDVLVTERQGRSKSRGPSNRCNHRSSSSKGKFADVECYHSVFFPVREKGIQVIHDTSEDLQDDMTELWHKRLGHMSEKGMFILSKKNVLSGVHDINLKKCSHCLAGKQTRRAFKSRPSFRTENILDLVHSDVCGPMKTKTLGGCSYFVTFIDDHSRKVWVYTLKTKDQVLDVFKQFHALVERQTGKKLKCIRSDNGGEYIGPFDAYCREHGIQHQKTPPKTPQLNGLAERMNRTLVKRVFEYGGVAFTCRVPDIVWSGKDVSYHHLRVFGCKASVHIPKDERSKLDAKNKPCVFLRYGQDELGYRLYDPVQKKLVRSRDVEFDENQTLKDVEKTEKEIIPQHNDDPINLDSIPSKHFDAQFGDDIQNDEEQNDEEHGADDVDAQEQPNLDEDVHLELL